jgi:hypothetical protein
MNNSNILDLLVNSDFSLTKINTLNLTILLNLLIIKRIKNKEILFEIIII